MLHKICTHCGEEKPTNEFYRDSKTKNGLRPSCKACEAARSAARYAADPEKFRHLSRTWAKVNPHKNRVRSHRWYHKNTKKVAIAAKVKRDADPKKNREKARAWNAKNTERHQNNVRAWRLANPDKVRAIQATRSARKHDATLNDLTSAQFIEICNAFAWRCAYCGRKSKLGPDHITPYKYNGANTLWNIVPCCRSCNSKKGTGAVLKPVQPLLLTIKPPRKKRD